MNAILMLQDGKIFSGKTTGPIKEVIGEVILNTAVVGYQEMATDPANRGKILVLTYPLVGNYGINPKFNESPQWQLSGLVVKETSRIISNWQAKTSLEDFAKKQDALILHKVDTRSLAVYLRHKGEMLGIIAGLSSDPKALLAKIDTYRKSQTRDLIRATSTAKSSYLGSNRARQKIAILDLGVTTDLLAQLQSLGAGIFILPHTATAKEITKTKAGGLIISNGPENDVSLEKIAETIRPLLGAIPILGISTGLHVLALAMGAKISRMKLGHHGINYPVAHPGSFKAEITVQNHSFVVDSDSLDKIKNVKAVGYHLNDRTIEEVANNKLRCMGIQYYPQSPGKGQVHSVLKRFMHQCATK
ncbi:MAG: carbamoyl-phosphate synthase small subunit [Candidatus Omnitrophota bacterium]|jgi:carbamoyl-phosphate synthase small subunit|nr:MAG: carbamoyl-phosphate synthase small subunit [Candidatus Omnitrophota bacterium]